MRYLELQPVHRGEGQGLIISAAGLLHAVQERGLDPHRHGGGAVQRHTVLLVAAVLFFFGCVGEGL